VHQVILLKSSGPMMFDLILDVMNGFWQLGDAHTASPITLLPTRVVQLAKSLVDPGRLASNLSRDPFNRPSGTGATLHHYPGTSCLATISLSLRDKTISVSLRDKTISVSLRDKTISVSLRDKSHPPIEAPRIKLALMGFTSDLPWGEVSLGSRPVAGAAELDRTVSRKTLLWRLMHSSATFRAHSYLDSAACRTKIRSFSRNEDQN
jgi:hypothetical protein